MNTPVPSIYSSASSWVSEVSPAARNTLDFARIPRASKLLICGLFQKGRVLAQDGDHNPLTRVSCWARWPRSRRLCAEVRAYKFLESRVLSSFVFLDTTGPTKIDGTATFEA